MNSRRFFVDRSIDLTAADSLFLDADSCRIEQVVENLMINAIEYGQANPISVRVSSENSAAQIIVEDHGLGIAPEVVDRIFDRFERAISARNISGLGLGLYVTRQIVEAHKGSIAVQSRLGEGYKLTVRLPIS